jgi:hypothetical protein
MDEDDVVGSKCGDGVWIIDDSLPIARASCISRAGTGAVSAELAIEVAKRICTSVLYEGMFEGRIVRQSFSALDKVVKMDKDKTIQRLERTKEAGI